MYSICPGAGGYDAICLIVEREFLQNGGQSHLVSYLEELKSKNEELKLMKFNLQIYDIEDSGIRVEVGDGEKVKEIEKFVSKLD